MKPSIVILSNANQFIEESLVTLRGAIKKTDNIMICHECNEAISYTHNHSESIILVDTVYSTLQLNTLYNEMNSALVPCVAICRDKDSIIKQLIEGAKDFLTLPLQMENLLELLRKYTGNTKVAAILPNSTNGKQENDRIAISTLEKVFILPVRNIVRCQSDNNYTNIYSSSLAPILVAKTLKHFENLLHRHNFLRVHRSHLINIEHIIEFKRGQGCIVRMTDHKEIEVATRRKNLFLKNFNHI